MACRGLDEQVVRQDKELEQLEKQFACVRIVQMNSLDLKVFQFDYDQTWCVFFLNADGTVYGRYGTRAGNGPNSTTHISVASLKKAMQRALALHNGYPANKAQLAGKLGIDPEYRTPEQIPGLTNRPARTEQRHDCIHCHQVREYSRRTRWQQKRLTYADIWVYPLPENIGLKMDVDDGLRVQSVTPNSPAAQSGFLAGDDLVSMNGQPLVSQADLQWVLHNAPVQTRLTVAMKRGGQTMQKTIALSDRWRESDLLWRASSWFGMRHGLDVVNSEAGVRVKTISANAAPLQRAGLQVGDVIVAADGKAVSNASQFIAYARLAHGPGEKMKLTVQRGGQQQELDVPMW